jgi:transposase
MQEGVIKISQKELTRYDVLRRVLDGRISLTDAAGYMGVSFRQAKRLKKRAEEGPIGLIHGNRGRSPSNKVCVELRERILEMSQGSYGNFNDTHLTEELVKQGADVCRESVRCILRHAGIRPKRKHKPRKHHRRRPRKTSEGLMMLWDGSPHRWFGNDVDPCCLMAAIDDATSKLLAALFCPVECSWAYLELLRRVVADHGVPCSVYQDKHTALKRNDDYWSLEEELAGKQEPPQVGAALEALGIEPIYANSPQAKGRVERAFGTLQDRLVAQMGLRGIFDSASANAYLEEEFIAEYNSRFGKAAAAEHTWRRLGPGVDLDRICSFHYKVKVANDNAIRFCGLVFDIPPGPGGRSYAGLEVELRQLLDGSWRIYYSNKIIATAESTEIGEPFMARKRRRDARAAYDCQWVYMASRQAAEDTEPPSGKAGRTCRLRHDPGRPIGATRIA